MSPQLLSIVRGLERVQGLRAARAADHELSARVELVKRYQHQRFERDYATLLASSRYGAAARFFLADLYGPVDFSARDAQFSKIVPALARLLPDAVVLTVEQLIELHALSEELDQQMAQHIGAAVLAPGDYARAWRLVDRLADRERQVTLMLLVGHALDRHTRSPMLGATLRMMRKPAHAAGLGDLQRFLESGFTAFAAMKGAEDFLATIASNEKAQITALFGS